jgi:predicted dinucleotide-binding enzyme
MIGVLGCGRMGVALIRSLLAIGRPVLAGARSWELSGRPDRELSGVSVVDYPTVLHHSRLVVVAVPYAAVVPVLTDPAAPPGGGRILIDATNPGIGVDGGPVSSGTSNGEALATALPGWRVVKAFNTVSAGMMSRPVFGGRALTLPIAGDDAAARDEVSTLAREMGFQPVDVGPVARAGELEAVAALLHMISVRHRLGGRIGLQVVGLDERVAVTAAD